MNISKISMYAKLSYKLFWCLKLIVFMCIQIFNMYLNIFIINMYILNVSIYYFILYF